MNIFILSLCPYLCAKYHNDKHVVKMILETAQMLSVTHYLCSEEEDIDETVLYKRTKAFANHPCTIWIRQSRGNYIWTYILFRELCKEYTYRYNKVHSCEKRFLNYFNNVPKLIPTGNITKFAMAMPDDVKNDNVVLAYRQYYIIYKSSFCKWTKREKPKWYSN